MICLTFDTDWMTEASLERFLEEFPIPGQATFFCHDAFRCLTASGHELGPHPFVSDLNNWRAGLEALTRRVSPGARGIRTHSCVFSHAIGVGLHELGFEYISQATNPYQHGLFPFRHPWGVWELPIYYMDNMDFWAGTNWPAIGHQPFHSQWIQQAITGPDLYVFDFHPIHVALNTRAPQDYESVKSRIIEDGASPFELGFPGRGARVYFQELCAAMVASNESSIGCAEAIDIWSHRHPGP